MRTASRPSLRGRLLTLLLMPVIAIILGASTVAYRVALEDSDRAQDQDLREDVEAMAKMLQRSRNLDADLPEQARFLIQYQPDGRNYYSVRSQRKGALYGSPQRIPPGPRAGSLRRPALYDTVVEGVPVRAAAIEMPSLQDPTDRTLVTLAEPLSDRGERAREILLIILPVLVAVVLLLLAAMWWAVSVGLRALDPLILRLALRGDELKPVTAIDVPSEILPLSHIIDDLLARLAEGRQLQERFIADAAHQLRTPLTGLSLHVERAASAADAQARASALAVLPSLVARMARSCSQLLSLTRVESAAGGSLAPVRIDLCLWLPEHAGTYLQQAEDAGVEFGFEGTPGPCVVTCDELGLHALVANLMDNAITYAGRGGSVTLGLRMQPGEKQIVLFVEDNGPGLDDSLYPRLGDRFFRAPGAAQGGSGLGLAIVRRIAQQAGALLQFVRAEPRGLRVEVVFPQRER